MAWIGRKKIAFIPVFWPNARPPDVIPADWNSDILRRVFYDPDKGIGPDRSLRSYIHAASSGVANFDAVVMPMATIDLQDVRLEFLDPLLDGPGLRKQGFHAAAIVMLGGVGAGTAQRGADAFWARFVMAEKLGTWAMELRPPKLDSTTQRFLRISTANKLKNRLSAPGECSQFAAKTHFNAESFILCP